MTGKEPIVIGVDLGTGGVRAVAATVDGQVLAAASEAFPDGPPEPASAPAPAPAPASAPAPAPVTASVPAPAPQGWHEQDATAWWPVSARVLGQLVQTLQARGIGPEALCGLAVDGTSGTVVALDADATPLRAAIMYNDARAEVEAEALNALAGPWCERLGYRFAASFALAKIAWIRQHEPEVFRRTAVFAHQADYLVACLLGEGVVTDYSNALKTGYDIQQDTWPDWLGALNGVLERLPPVVAPGTVLGRVGRQAARSTGLPAGLPVVAGATDGTAACLASGVRRIGDCNTTLGTTLVFKALSAHPVRHPDGLLYSHKLPGGRWLPGAASNTGGEWIGAEFPGENPAALDARAAVRLPVDVLAYPLVRQGERFPFLSAAARGLLPDPGLAPGTRYAACLQGTALVERLAYQVLEEATGTAGGAVYTTGGGSRSAVWTQLRADVTGRPYYRPVCPESAFGSAVLAAAGTVYEDPWAAVDAMVRIDRTFAPGLACRPRYDALYGRLQEHLQSRGWL